MILHELYHIISTYGVDYIKNPESRAQIIKVTFMVMMKIISMVRNRVSKNNDDEHIECNCNSCKVWRAKLDDACKNKYEFSAHSGESKPKKERKIASMISKLFFNKKE